MDDLIPVGPVRIRVRLLAGVRGAAARLLAANRAVKSARPDNETAEFKFESVLNHVVVVIEWAWPNQIGTILKPASTSLQYSYNFPQNSFVEPLRTGPRFVRLMKVLRFEGEGVLCPACE
jgi:hypothetical protein